MNPVMPILRERELVYILNFCEAKVFVVPKTYRGFDYAAMAQGMRGDLPNLKAGVYHFGPGDFALHLLREGDYRGDIGVAETASCLEQTKQPQEFIYQSIGFGARPFQRQVCSADSADQHNR